MEIYAEISRRLASKIEQGKKFYLPDGVEVRKTGRRSYFFDCSEDSREDLIDFLEANGISWQDNDEPTEAKHIKVKKMIEMDWMGNVN